MIKSVQAFQDSAGRTHVSRLQALVAEKHIETRAVLAKGAEAMGFKLNGTISCEDAVKLCSANAPDLANVARRFDKMIRNERSKGANVVMGTH